MFYFLQNTRATWADNKKCADHTYESNVNGLSLADCISKKQIYEYNRKKGLTNYIDPFAQLFCVRFNHAPKMGYYWADKKELTAQEIQDLRNNENKSGFIASYLGNVQATATTDQKKYYKLGESMRSQICG